MLHFLQRFALLVAGTLSGFDRLVFKGKLCPLYSPEGMNYLLRANHVAPKEFKQYAKEVTARVIEASGVPWAKAHGRYRYLNSSKTNKEQAAREFVPARGPKPNLVCVLACVEPCWTFDWVTGPEGSTIRGEPGKCMHLYHYYLHPIFGWLYVRLQTWFPFEIQVGLNGREWLARQMDRDKLRYRRHDNKFLWIRDWQRAQQLLDEQLQTDWQHELDAMQQQVHPLHPNHWGGRMPVKYNWTAYQSEWATDIAFRRQEELEPWFERWLRQAMLSYDYHDILSFFGHAPSLYRKGRYRIETSVLANFEGKRVKHWVDHNSLKMYHEANVLRTETTINDANAIQVMRPSVDDPEGPEAGRPMRRSVVDLPQRAAYCQAVNERYVEALAATAETRTVRELVEPLTRRVPEPSQESGKPARYVRGMNPLAELDAALLTAISDPRWMLRGLRNRDLVAALYPTASEDPAERRRRSARVTRLLRLLRGHGLLEKIPRSHRYQIGAEARAQIQALLACRNANPDRLVTNAA